MKAYQPFKCHLLHSTTNYITGQGSLAHLSQKILLSASDMEVNKLFRHRQMEFIGGANYDFDWLQWESTRPWHAHSNGIMSPKDAEVCAIDRTINPCQYNSLDERLRSHAMHWQSVPSERESLTIQTIAEIDYLKNFFLPIMVILWNCLRNYSYDRVGGIQLARGG